MAQRRTLAAPRIPWALALGLVTLLARPTFCPAESVKCTGGVKVVPRERLFVSEPNPEWFGNGPNPDVPETQNWTNANWLKSRFHFNFAEYSHGPSNFGVLRVMNDDLVQPRRGFGPHPHRDMEILTFILQGNLTHKDSTGTQEILDAEACNTWLQAVECFTLSRICTMNHCALSNAGFCRDREGWIPGMGLWQVTLLQRLPASISGVILSRMYLLKLKHLWRSTKLPGQSANVEKLFAAQTRTAVRLC